MKLVEFFIEFWKFKSVKKFYYKFNKLSNKVYKHKKVPMKNSIKYLLIRNVFEKEVKDLDFYRKVHEEVAEE